MFLYGRADRCLLDGHEEVAPSLETRQPCTRNGGSSELGIVVGLQRVVRGMEYQCRRLDGGNPVTRQRSAIIEHNARASQRNRVHLLDDAVNQFLLPGGKLNNDGIGSSHQSHELLLE